jgi:gliding motility-associated-like protein
MKLRFSLFINFLVFTFSFAQTPTLEWAKGFGGLEDERVGGIAVDNSGNVFVAGGFKSTVDFDPSTGTAIHTTPANYDFDAYISKFDSNGNFLWVKTFGGLTIGWDEIFAITTDAAGNVYVTGFFKNTVDFDPGAAVFNMTEMGYGSGDMFISKFDTNGNFIFAKQIGGNGSEIPRGIALDNSGNIYTTGEINSAKLSNGTILTTDFDPGIGVFPLSSTTALDGDVFISKLDSAGNFVWAKNMGGDYYDNSKAIDIDALGNIYITGTFRNVADFDPSTSVANLTAAGTNYDDIFVAKYDTNANYLWAKSFGSTNKDDSGYGIKVDVFGNVYTTGIFQNTVDFDPNLGVANLNGGFNSLYISKLDTNGNYVWAKTFVGSGSAGKAIDLDALGNVYTTGYFSGTCDFDPNAGVVNLSAVGGAAYHFVSKLDTNGNYIWAKSFGNTLNNNNNTFGSAIVVDNLLNVHTSGTFNSVVDFDPCPTEVNVSNVGLYDVFVQKLSQTIINGPTFSTIPSICSGSIVPVLPTTSTNGVTGTWSPSVVSNTTSGTYTFTPNPGQCVTLTTTATITVNPIVNSTFTPIVDFCSGSVAPILPTTSNNGIVGTWNPTVVSNSASGTYIFTPNSGQCGTSVVMNINVIPTLTPIFTQVASICAGQTLSALPTLSNNGISGSWSPAINNFATTLYTFTPTSGICATTQTMTITVNSSIPTFTQVAPICSGAFMPPLPIVSNNGILGSWSPTLNNLATTTYMFTPTLGQCAALQTMTIVVNNPVTPIFTQIAPICSGSTLSSLPTISTNGITGSWTPALNNLATTTYTFTPTLGQCATLQTMTIVVNTPITPVFTQISPICSGTTLANLPTTSNNGIIGNWSPTINNTATTTYTFIPSVGQCATIQTLTIIVNQPVVPVFSQVSPICLGNSLATLPTTSNNGINGSWSPAINNLATTTYTFTPTSGLCATTQTMTIQVNSVTPIFVQPEPICIGETISALPITSSNGIVGSWSPIINNLATTTYFFTPNAGQCATSQTLTIEVKPFIQLTVSINQLEYFNSDNQSIEVTVSPQGNYLFTLDDEISQFSNVFENISSCDHKIKVQDVTGCGKSDVEIDFFIWDYPKFFTPNGDGINDYWNIYCNDFQEATITIYDRYGKLIKQFSSKTIGWDGKCNGVDLFSTDYWFTVEYKQNGINKIFKSHFAMKR